MADAPAETLSGLFDAMRRGEEGAEQRLFDLVYGELRRIAHGRMIRARPGQTFQTTALVNEAYVRMAGGAGRGHWKDRQHFLRAAAIAMRHILVDRARKARSMRHGSDRFETSGDERIPAQDPPVDLLALDEVLTRLAGQSPRLAEVVHYRFFLGMTVAETADLLRVSPRTVDSDWLLAKTWLRREMSQGFALGEDRAGGS